MEHNSGGTAGVSSEKCPGGLSACNAGDPGSIPGLGRSPGEGNGTPLQYTCLGNPMDGGAWWAAVHGVTKSRTRLSNFSFTLTDDIYRGRLQPDIHLLEKNRG